MFFMIFIVILKKIEYNYNPNNDSFYINVYKTNLYV